jgi:O-antigen/teichoic acid export membrane protein
LAILLVAAGLGVLVTLILVWQSPRLLGAVPASLYPDVRRSMLLIGISQSIGLVGSVYAAVFIGLQRYTVPVLISIVNRSLFAALVIVVAYYHGSLTAMGVVGAAANLFAACLQWVAWSRYASYVQVKLSLIRLPAVKEMLKYCSVLAVWSGASLCISGLDVVIVGHYDFAQTGYYSIATLPNNLMVALLTAMLSPLIPSASALGIRKTPAEMANVLARAARYASFFLLLSGMPLIVGGRTILHLWVGGSYAQHTVGYLRILVAANTIRYMFAPYSTMIVGLGRQKAASASCIVEAIVNLGSSILLAQRFGAIGVAYGTLLGAIVGVVVHVQVSMRNTRQHVAIAPAHYLMEAVWKPMLIAALVLCALFFERGSDGLFQGIFVLLACTASVAVLGWALMLTRAERQGLLAMARLPARWRVAREG